MSQDVQTIFKIDKEWKRIISRFNLITIGLLIDLILFAIPLLLMQSKLRHDPLVGGLLMAAAAIWLILLVLALTLKLRRLALGMTITILLSPAAVLIAPLAFAMSFERSPTIFHGWSRRSPPTPPQPSAPLQTTLRITDQEGLSLAGVSVPVTLSTGRLNESPKTLTLLSDDNGIISIDTRPSAYHTIEVKTPDFPAPDGWYYMNHESWNFRYDEKSGWIFNSYQSDRKEEVSRWHASGTMTIVMMKGEPPDRMLSRRSELRAPPQDVLTMSYDVIGDQWTEGYCPGCDFSLRIEGCQSHCGSASMHDPKHLRITVSAGKGGGIQSIGSVQRSDWPEQMPESGLSRQIDFVAKSCRTSDQGFLFSSRAGKLNGQVGFNVQCPYVNPGNISEKPPEWGSIQVIANPRGSRNLRESRNSYSNLQTGSSRPFLQDKHLNLDRIQITESVLAEGGALTIRGAAGAANRGVQVSVSGQSYEDIYGDGSFEIKTVQAPDLRLEISYDWPKGCKQDCDQERFPIAWLPGGRGSGSAAVIPVSRAREFLPLIADPVCPMGRVLASAKEGYCCWPGQHWEDRHCAGTPERCPPGLNPEGTLCAGAWVYIPPGEFWMGCLPQDRECAKDELPRHRVKISRGFWMMRRLMTENEWLNDHVAPDEYMDMLPYRGVSFEQAQRFCGEFGSRLPTEAEWEYTTRAGRETIYSGGDIFEYDPDKSSKFQGYIRSDYRSPVDWNPPNSFGLLDMAGNIPVWISDFYDNEYYAHSPAVDPIGPDRGVSHVMRGAANYEKSPAFRLSRRISDDGQRYSAGLRCVRDTPPADINRLLP